MEQKLKELESKIKNAKNPEVKKELLAEMKKLKAEAKKEPQVVKPTDKTSDIKPAQKPIEIKPPEKKAKKVWDPKNSTMVNSVPQFKRQLDAQKKKAEASRQAAEG